MLVLVSVKEMNAIDVEVVGIVVVEHLVRGGHLVGAEEEVVVVGVSSLDLGFLDESLLSHKADN